MLDGRMLAQLSQHGPSIQVRHEDVEDNQLGLEVLDLLYRRTAIQDRVDLVACSGEVLAEHILRIHIVVDDHNTTWLQVRPELLDRRIADRDRRWLECSGEAGD